ncbi:MAG: ECF transporter S component, partial [Odoribacter sp.]|nr:ECF transporter S component [Odoribacter sp.]
LLTAILSPLVNSLLFGMPLTVNLPAIILKSVLLAAAAGYAAYRFRRLSLLILTAVVLSYQIVGTLGEWLISGDFFLALQDFRIGLPGIFLQIFGGYFFLRHILSK